MNMRDVGGLRIIGFADDTLFLMQAESAREMKKIMTAGINPSVRKMGRMGYKLRLIRPRQW